MSQYINMPAGAIGSPSRFSIQRWWRILVAMVLGALLGAAAMGFLNTQSPTDDAMVEAESPAVASPSAGSELVPGTAAGVVSLSNEIDPFEARLVSPRLEANVAAVPEVGAGVVSLSDEIDPFEARLVPPGLKANVAVVPEAVDGRTGSAPERSAWIPR